jgi:hypothetical protein
VKVEETEWSYLQLQGGNLLLHCIGIAAEGDPCVTAIPNGNKGQWSSLLGMEHPGGAVRNKERQEASDYV